MTFQSSSYRVLSLVLAATSVSCAVADPHQVNEDYREVLAQRHNQYEIAPGDSVAVSLYGLEGSPLDQVGLVLPDGRSDLFFLHNHRFEGRSVLEVEADLRSRLAREVTDPSEISVQVTPAPEVVYLSGELVSPTTLTLTPKMTLGEAIAATRGIRITADSDYALLVRPFKNPLHPVRYRVDLNDTSEEIFLLPGDQLFVEKTYLALFIEYVREYVFGIIPSALYTPSIAGALAF